MTDALSPLVLPFPIREHFMAQIVIPSNMTKVEAERLCAFVQSLAQPQPEPTEEGRQHD